MITNSEWLQYLTRIAKNHWGKIAAWLFSGGLSQLDQKWLNLLPMSADQNFAGLAFALVLSFFTIATSALRIEFTLLQLSFQEQCKQLLKLAGVWLLTTIGAILAFFYVDNLWKTTANNNAAVLLRDWGQPFAYGAVFASFVGVAFCVISFAMLYLGRTRG